MFNMLPRSPRKPTPLDAQVAQRRDQQYAAAAEAHGHQFAEAAAISAEAAEDIGPAPKKVCHCCIASPP